MSIRVLIVEDEVLVAEDISSDLESYGFSVSDIACSSEECFEAIEKELPNVVLMDVKIKGNIDGITLAQNITNQYDLPIIFLTANSDTPTVSRALKTKPQAFITKPYHKKDLLVAIELAFEKFNAHLLEQEDTAIDSVFVRSGNYFEKVKLEDIAYIKAAGSYTEIILSNDKQYTLSKNLMHFQNEVKHPEFVKVHRSYIVNQSKVDAFGPDSIVIGKHEIPVSRQYSDSLKRFKKL